MLTVPHNLNSQIEKNLISFSTGPDESNTCFDFIYNLFLDERIYELHDEYVLENAWELELATYDDVIRLPDHIYDLVHFHPNPLVRRGWLSFCRQTRCINLKPSVQEFLNDKDAYTQEIARKLFHRLEEAERQRLNVPDADKMNVEQAKLILGDHFFSEAAKIQAINSIWSFSHHASLDESEKAAYTNQRQPILAETMPLLMSNFKNPFTGGGFFKLHLDVVMSRAEPMSDALIEQKRNRLLYCWWKDATLSFSYGLAHTPSEKREECINFMRSVLDTDFYRLGKLIIRDQLNSIQK